VKNSYDIDFPIVIEVLGPMKPYITLEREEIDLKPKEINCQKYHLKLPMEFDEYGPVVTVIQAHKKSSDGGSFGAIVYIKHRLTVFFPYPDKYVEIKVKSEDVIENQPVHFTISATNYGQETVKKANARIDIYGADDYSNFIESLDTDTKELESMQSKDFTSVLITEGLVPGYYKAKVDFFYDGDRVTDENIFKIGTLLVKILNYTREGTTNKIVPYVINVERRWNNKIDTLYAEVTFDEIDQKITTPTISINAWEKTQLKGYIDLKDISPGEYTGKIVLYYQNETTSKDIMLKVTKENIITEKQVQAEPEQPKDTNEFSSGISITNILLIVIIALILIDMGYIIWRKKHEN